MINHRALKILTVIFSISIGALVTYQLSKNISGGSNDQTTKQDPSPQSEDQKEEDPVVITIGPKSIGGALDMSDLIKPEEEVKKTEKPPLLPSSKSASFLFEDQ